MTGHVIEDVQSGYDRGGLSRPRGGPLVSTNEQPVSETAVQSAKRSRP
ncbi:MAG TPA: hypothetical protein VNO30_25855 [Kofleriaceae bacterium]|nr:hypothetical protein [Kofleriaceae bacterium]